VLTVKEPNNLTWNKRAVEGSCCDLSNPETRHADL